MLLTYSCSTSGKLLATERSNLGRERPLLRKRRVLLYLFVSLVIVMSFTLLVVPELCIWFIFNFKCRSVGSTLRHVERKYVRGEVYFRLTKTDKMYQRAYWNGRWAGEETTKNNHDGDSDGDSSEADSDSRVIRQNLHCMSPNHMRTCT